jgi:hypothetical protein
MKKIILGIFVFMSFLSNAQEHKMEDNALAGIFEAKGKTKPQSILRDLTVMQNSDISPLRLDRSIFVYYNESSIESKRDVAFDENGNQTLFINYSWNTTSQSLVPSSKSEYSYDVNDNQTLEINYSWNTNTQSFVPNGKEEYIYDANGNQTLRIDYFWNTDTQSFVLYYKYENTYDAEGNLTLQIIYSWNTTTQSFVPYAKGEATYDSNGNYTLILYYNWSTTTQSFVSNGKSEYSYDVNGNQTLQINYSWNTTFQFFVPSSKYEYSYDASGNQTLRIVYSWNTTNQSFVQNSKYEYAYDVNGNQTLYIYYSWNGNTQSFVPNYKEEWTFDANGNQTLRINYGWNNITQSFVPVSKYVRTYNNGLPITFLTQAIAYKWYSDLGVYKPSFKTEGATILDNDTQLHRKGVLYKYDTNFNVWNELVGDEYNSYEYYTKTALSTETIDNELISIYPNPTSDLLYVSHPALNSLDIQITDLSGRQMYSGTMQKEVPLNVSSYARGIYLVTVENKETNKKKTYKIVKK